MTSQVTHWLTFGEPTGRDSVWAARLIEYETGPAESRSDDITIGTVPIDVFNAVQQSDHLHTDGSLMVSALDDETRTMVEEGFDPQTLLNEVATRATETTPTQALDGYVLETLPLNARQWAEMTGRDRSTVVRNAATD